MKMTNDGNYPVAQHLDEADLIAHLDGELTVDEQDYARTHLESCWSCRSRLLGVQNSIESFLRVRKQVMPAEIPPSGPAIAQFRRRLTQHSAVRPPLRQHLTNWWRASWPELSFNFALKHKKATLGTALAGLVLLFTIIDPFDWNRVSADELLTRADAYELLHELGAGKIVHAKVRIDRISLATRAENRIGEIETMQDERTSAVYVSAQYASGASRKDLVPDRDRVAIVRPFIADMNPTMANYLSVEGWLPQVSVSSYRRLISGRGLSGGDGTFAIRRGDTYELHHAFVPAHASGITETVLVLNAQSYAPEGISILTTENNERFEYQVKRLLFESVERTPDVAKLFETLKVEEKVALKPETAPEPVKKQPAEELLVAPPPSPAATAKFEVEVLGLLSQINADLGQEVIVTRLQHGTLKVEAVVDTEKRKNEIFVALAPVANNPALTLQIETSWEAQQRALDTRASNPRSETAAITTEAVANNSIAVQAQVRQYLQQRGIPQQLIDTEVGRTANQIVMRSHRAMLHVWALKSLVQRFSAADLKTLDDEGRTKWLQMISKRAAEFRKESSLLHQEIAVIFNVPVKTGGMEREINDEAQLIRALTQLIDQASHNHEVIRSAFTISTGSNSPSAITAPQFWHSMVEAESTAASIQSATQRLKQGSR